MKHIKRPGEPPNPESASKGVKGVYPLEEVPASMLAKASTNEWRNVVEARTSETTQSSTLMRPKKGNPTLEIPPLYYNPQEHTGWVYIVANRPNGHIYIGQTTNLPRRAHEHRKGLIPGYSKDHGCKLLVYFEGFQLITESIAREDAMKYWLRSWKIRRILATNPEWRDLYANVCQTH